MYPISVVQSSMEVYGTLREGELLTFPNGDVQFTCKIARGRSASLAVAA